MFNPSSSLLPMLLEFEGCEGALTDVVSGRSVKPTANGFAGDTGSSSVAAKGSDGSNRNSGKLASIDESSIVRSSSFPSSSAMTQAEAEVARLFGWTVGDQCAIPMMIL